MEPPEPAEGEEAEAAGGEGEGGLLPSFPKYEGLGFAAGDAPPAAAADVAFPPAEAPTLQAALAAAAAAAVAAIGV